MSAEDFTALQTYSSQELADTVARLRAELAALGDFRRYDGRFEGRPCVQLSGWINDVCPFPGCSQPCASLQQKKLHCVRRHSAPFTGIEVVSTRRRQGAPDPRENCFIREMRASRK
jgi:hypothetical protein